MNIFQQIANFFVSLFQSSKPETVAKRELRKLEQNLRVAPIPVLKQGLIQISVAEAFFILYTETRPFAKLVNSTYKNEKEQIAMKYNQLLFYSGFTAQENEVLKEFEFSNRKMMVKEAKNPKKEYENQRRKFEHFLRELNIENFAKIEKVIQMLDCFADVCNYDYISLFKNFDFNFDASNPDYMPVFHPIPLKSIETQLLDWYYFASNFELTTSVANAIIAIQEQSLGRPLDNDEKIKTFSSLRKIANIFYNALPASIIESLLRLIKEDFGFVPNKQKMSSQYFEAFTIKLKTVFVADEQKISLELQDEKISSELQSLFGDIPLMPNIGYNNEINSMLQQNSSCTFLWMTPFNILKNFVSNYYTTQYRTFFEALIVEGFFDKTEYQSSFASAVFQCNEIDSKISEFEATFQDGNENSRHSINNFIQDSMKDESLSKNLTKKIDGINLQVKILLETYTSNLFQLKKFIDDLISDAHKSSPDHITNIKFLFASLRNKDNVEFIEKTIGQWDKFFDVMRNYITIEEGGKKS